MRPRGKHMRITGMSSLSIPAEAALEQECFSHPWSEESLTDSFNNPASYFFVAKDDDGNVIGYVGAYMVRDEAFLNNVAVTKSARRQGVGRALMEKMIETVSAEGASFLSLEVRFSNQAAADLYRSLGFEPEGVRKKFYRDPEEDALIMTLYFETERPFEGGGFEIIK